MDGGGGLERGPELVRQQQRLAHPKEQAEGDEEGGDVQRRLDRLQDRIARRRMAAGVTVRVVAAGAVAAVEAEAAVIEEAQAPRDLVTHARRRAPRGRAHIRERARHARHQRGRLRAAACRHTRGQRHRHGGAWLRQK